MDIALSDVLTCPRCGPTYGLVLLPEEVRDRRVVSGVLGCANCRERYTVEGGVPDLRAGRQVEEPSPGGGGPGGEAVRRGGVEPDREGAVRLAALLGLTEAGGRIVVGGPAAVHAGLLMELVPGVSVVVVDGTGIYASAEGNVSSLRVGEALPLRGGSARGVALTGSRAVLVEEGARLLGPGGRLVLDPAPEGARARVEAVGLRVVLEESGVVVAGRGQ